MAAVFLIGYPVGSIMMPVLGNWLIHAGWQVFAFVGMWVGFALGYVLSSRIGTVSSHASMTPHGPTLLSSSSYRLLTSFTLVLPGCTHAARCHDLHPHDGTADPWLATS
jgi:hypothetical protein